MNYSLGNLRTDEKGNAYLVQKSPIKLIGENSILGRSCVVSNNKDEYMSK